MFTLLVTCLAFSFALLLPSAPALADTEASHRVAAGILKGMRDVSLPGEVDSLEGPSSIISGSNYTFNCREARAAVQDGGENLALVSGFTLGVTDMLAGLYCLIGDFRCSCLRNGPVGDPGGYGFEVGRELGGCPGFDPAFGAVTRGAFRFCGFRN